MDGIRVSIVALLLCAAPIGGVVTASDIAVGPLQTDEESDPSMSVITAENTTGYLTPPPARLDRTEARTAGIDVAGAVEADTGQLRSVYLEESVQRRYQNAETTDDRRAIIEESVDRLSRRTDELETKETAAIRRFNDGTVSEHELLRTLVAVHREAEGTGEALEWLESTAEDHGLEEAADRAATDQVRLIPMNGPVRAQVARSLEGESSSRVYVETAADGIVLSTVTPNGETYLREAHDPTAKRVDVSDRYEGNPSPALDRFTELYPWAINSFEAIDAMGPAQVRLYRFGANHPHGTLETYLDSGSTEILYETQRIELDGVPTTTFERTDGELRLVLNATRAGGPIGISVVDTLTDERVDAEIELNDESIGSTEGERLQTVAPRGTTTVNATHDGESVSLNTNLG